MADFSFKPELSELRLILLRTSDFELSKPMDIRSGSMTIQGNEIEVLHDGKLNAGEHLFKVGCSKVSEQVYYYKTEGKDFSTTKRMMLVK